MKTKGMNKKIPLLLLLALPIYPCLTPALCLALPLPGSLLHHPWLTLNPAPTPWMAAGVCFSRDPLVATSLTRGVYGTQNLNSE